MTETIEKSRAAAAKTRDTLPVKPKKGLPKTVRVIFCTLICVVLFAVCILSAAYFIIGTVINKDKTDALIKSIDYEEICVADNSGIRVSLRELFGGSMAVGYSGKADLTKVIEDTGIDEEIAERLYSYAEFIAYDKEPNEIKKRDIEKFYEKNLEKIEKSMGISFSESDKEKFYNALDANEKMLDSFSKNSIEESFGAVLGAVRFLASPAGIVVLAVMGTVLMLLFMLASKSVGGGFIAAGAAASLTGGLGITALILMLNGKIGISLESSEIASVVFHGAASVYAADMINIMTYFISAGLAAAAVGIGINIVIKRIRKEKEMRSYHE